MSCELSEVPAFATWKMLSNTIQLLHNIGTSGKSLERLSNCVQNPEMSQMFVISSTNLPYDEYQEMSERYKAFTIWVLGQFFHLSTMPNLQKVQSSFIDAQNRILYQIKLTAQSHTYYDLVAEYVTVLEQLNKYGEDKYQGSITLNAFISIIPLDLHSALNIKETNIAVNCRETCIAMQQVILQIFEIVAIELADSYYTGGTLIRLMNCLLSLLTYANLSLKLSVLNIYVKTLKSGFGLQHDVLAIKSIQDSMFSIFETLFIAYYKQYPKMFEPLAIDLFEVYNTNEKTQRLYEYAIHEADGKLKHLAEKYCTNVQVCDQFALLSQCKDKIITEIRQFGSTNLYTEVFHHIYAQLTKNELVSNENSQCNLNERWYEQMQTFLETCIHAKFETQYVLLDESKFVDMFFTVLSSHIEHCSCKLDAKQFFETMCLVVALGNSKFANTIHNCIEFLWHREKMTRSLSNPHLQRIFIELRSQKLENFVILKYWSAFMIALSICPDENYAVHEQRFLKVAAAVMERCDLKCQQILIEDAVALMAITTLREDFYKSIVAPAIVADVEILQRSFTACLPQLFTMLCAKFDRVVHFENHTLRVHIYAHDIKHPDGYYVIETRPQASDDFNSSEIVNLLKGTLRFLKPESHIDSICSVNAIKALPYIAKLVPAFIQIIVSKWMQAVEIVSDDNAVQNTFVDNIFDILQFPLLNATLSQEVKNNFLERFFDVFMEYVDKSLRCQDKLCWQSTLCSILEQISFINYPSIELTFLKCILHYIIMITSNVKHKAWAILIQYQEKNGTVLSRLFTKYRRALYKVIAHLCVINFVVAQCNLSNSLGLIAVELGYTDVKHMLVEDTRYILPYFVSRYANTTEIQNLLDTIAYYNDTELKDLLADNYGYIYVHLTLNCNDKDSEECLRYVEGYTGETGITLRKTHFMIILNELLLHFFERRERVLNSLQLLASEDSPMTGPLAIKEYLRPRLLGVLQYFDLKLLAKSHKYENKLLSLAAVFQYMGPKYITPVRFKIIATLRTVLAQSEGAFMDQHCVVWEAFIQNCELEILRPQLAALCASINPLIASNPAKINDILVYLIIKNHQILKDYIVDLFFLLDFDVDVSIQKVLKKHLSKVQAMQFKDHLKFFMKYLTYETIEIQIYALKYIAKLLQANKLELEAMVLGFNGIDSSIVELINYLLRGCREYDLKLQLACGEVIGELGAIEPSHLPPPSSVCDEADFTFTITEPKFIANSLNEFARAMQAEVNCQNMDRFALAIQETLRTYGIGPKQGDNEFWNSLTESQKELMLPLVSSKYCIVSNTAIVHSGPIYGSRLGSTFKSWLDNWTTKLISTIISAKNLLLCQYIPSMKQDNRTLMYFLPHILLNSIIEGNSMQQDEAFSEFMAVIESKHEYITEIELSEHLFRISQQLPLNQSNVSNQKFHRDHLKVAFVLFDFLERWQREWIWQNGFSGHENSDYSKIKAFTQRFCKYKLAKSNFEFGGYPRALMYLEDHIMSNEDECEEYLSLLSKIYYRLNEPDGVAGVAAMRKIETNLEQRILDHEASGEISLATACYERLQGNERHLIGIVKSHMDQDNARTALHIAKSAWDEVHTRVGSSNIDKQWMLEAQSEALLRLGRYDELDNMLQRRELQLSHNWGVRTGCALMHFRNGNQSAFKEQLQTLKMIQVRALGASRLDEGTYQYGYYYIARLHAINELEHVANTVNELWARSQDESFVKDVIGKMQVEWNLRLQFVQQNVKVIEPILCLRRAALEIAREKTAKSAEPLFRSLLGDTWLKSAVVAMNSQFHKQAYSYIIKAEEFAPPRLFIEKAKWFWLCNEHEQSLTTLDQNLRVLLPSGKIPADADFPLWKRKLCAEAKLHVATYNDTISNVVVDVNIQHYKEAVEMFKECEKSLVNLAQYYDRVFQNIPDEDKDLKGSDMQIHMINYYGKSLQYGTEFIYQSMPRLLSIWFDYGTRLLDVGTPAIREQRQHNLLKMTKLIDTFLERLPAFIFLTAFSQIISRICHPQKEVYKELNLVIAKLILQYPQQTLWMMISVIKSSYALRSKRCTDVLTDSRLKFPAMVKFLKDFVQLAEKLIELTNKELHLNVTTINVNSVVRTLPRLISQPDFSEIMIPTHKFRKLILPNQDSFKGSYNPFPNHFVHIAGIEDEMTILPSLQKPRRIKLRGSDGKIYIQMLKPKDDLRKDFRLMEFNDIVNQLLAKEAESRERRLNIRLYSVAPLNEECGMIEWVPNLVGLRPTIMTIYRQRGLGMKTRELKEKSAKQTDPLERKRDIFKNILLARHPPVLGDWFRRSFPDAHGWLTARTAYTRTIAVMSMVGHILGLGDRHGENILLDSTCGDAIHVDFNCLFNKGEQFDWPERVPFRLTQNMVAAMGPLGVEGMFRKSCACTLHVLRTHADTLMSIVTPFVYDPLVSWPKKTSNTSDTNSERTNELALEHIKVIQQRLEGKVKGRSYSISLSVDGQTNKLIAEAMNIDNLCQMYIGWGPHL